jgi:hypothetical protein
MSDVENIRSRLEAIAEELAELAYAALRESAAGGGGAGEERRLTRARRAVERAAAALRAEGD